MKTVQGLSTLYPPSNHLFRTPYSSEIEHLCWN